MEGFGQPQGFPWTSLPFDPLHALLKHSDCDGEIGPNDCAQVARRLAELLPVLPAEWRETTQQFIDGCCAAALANEPLDFH